jgi:predicted acyl esterase
VNNGWEKEPRVAVQVRRPDGAAWRNETAWPLPGTQWEHYYLDAAGGSMSPALGLPRPLRNLIQDWAMD